MDVRNRFHYWVLVLVSLTHVLLLYLIIHKKVLPPSEEIVVSAELVGDPIYSFYLKKRAQGGLKNEGDQLQLNMKGVALLSPPNIPVPLPELPLELIIDNPSNEAERYFKFEELSTSAVPQSDFMIPIQAAIPTVINAKVEVYVGRDGVVQVVKVLLINIPSFTEELKKAIFATRFIPATRDGFPVNSIKTMELSISF